MPRFLKWLLVLLLVPVLLLAAIGLALQRWVGSDDFRERASQRLSATLGVPVALGAIGVEMWPLPAVALERVNVQTRPPLTLGRIEARPVWMALLQRRLEISTLIVREGVIPQNAVVAIAAVMQKTKRAGVSPGEATGGPDSMKLLPRRTVLDGVTWLDSRGAAVTVDAQATLDDDGLPHVVELKVRKGRFDGAKASLQRQADHWALRADVGGGTVTGKVQVQPAAKGGSKLQGQFEIAGVEVAALTAPSRPLTGRLDAHTTVSADFRDIGELTDAMRTDTRFTVRSAVVHGLDLARAVQSVGLSRGGETRLDTLSGHVSTQGHAAQLNNLVATSGALTASGQLALAPNRSLTGRISVDLASGAAGGAIGVPLAVGGTLDEPTVQLTRGALIGAAIGTAVAPGLGTGAGAKLGDALGRIFGK
ncbi:MAG: hypothetical protein ABIU58_08680 [Ramlibacter sp.]